MVWGCWPDSVSQHRFQCRLFWSPLWSLQFQERISYLIRRSTIILLPINLLYYVIYEDWIPTHSKWKRDFDRPNNIVACSPHAGAVETQKPRGTRLHNSSGAFRTAPCLPFLPLHSSRFDSHRALLGDAVNTGLHNSTRRRFLPHVRFRVHRRDWSQC
jgi:hypothetical protein